ncbi:hypothetical protein PHYSODRAFT_476571, partial [Phytophthora sojae]
MSPYAVSANSLAFIGPAHAPTLTEFCYVRVLHLEGDSATVCVVGPDAGEDGHELQLPVAAIDLRVVDAAEAELWPGDYVGQPVAFVQPSGPSTGQWAYGVVIRYEMLAAGPSLSVLVGQEDTTVRLCEPLRIIKADPITYALQVGATVTDMVLNAKELLVQ